MQFFASNILKLLSNLSIIRPRSVGSTLVEVGKLDAISEKYKTGQLVLHKVYGYRGVVLFSWLAKIYDHDMLPESAKDFTQTVLKPHRFYQVLVDNRDLKFIKSQNQAIPFISLDKSKPPNLQLILSGLDYVAHDDIIPYTSTEQIPLRHNFIDQFLTYIKYINPPYMANSNLVMWRKTYYPCLELSDVHRQTTKNVRVTVIPFYVGRREDKAKYIYLWRYSVRLENVGTEAVQLKESCWNIDSVSATLNNVRGKGVVGMEPFLSTVGTAFQYSGHVSLGAPCGYMWGSFRMERDDGSSFDCKVPKFPLQSPVQKCPEPSSSSDKD